MNYRQTLFDNCWQHYVLNESVKSSMYIVHMLLNAKDDSICTVNQRLVQELMEVPAVDKRTPRAVLLKNIAVRYHLTFPDMFDESTLEPTMIARAAIKRRETVYHLPRPARHGTIIHYVTDNNLEQRTFGNGDDDIQGFTLANGTFVDRVEARLLAEKHDQLIDRAGNHDELYSEDVW